MFHFCSRALIAFIALGLSGQCVQAQEIKTRPPKLVRAELNLEGNFDFLARATEISKNPETREFGLQTLQDVSRGIAEIFYSDDFYDQRDTPLQNRAYLTELVVYFETHIQKQIVNRIYTVDTLEGLISAFEDQKTQMLKESTRPQAERTRQSRQTNWKAAGFFGLGATVVGEVGYRVASRLWRKGRLLWQNRSTGEMWSRTRETIGRLKQMRKSKSEREKREICKTRIAGLVHDLKGAARFLAIRAAVSAGVGGVSYATYFEDFETYDASDDLVSNRILPFLKSLKKAIVP